MRNDDNIGGLNGKENVEILPTAYHLCTYTISLDKGYDVHTIKAVEFAWDPAKARENIRVHGIDLADAVGVFDNPYLPWEDSNAEGESRFVALGMDVLARLLVVDYTYRPGKIRLISARKATEKEEKEYARRVRFQ